MSLRARALNGWLRWTEKPFLTRARSVRALRTSFEIKSRVFFHAPRGTGATWRDLAGRPALRVAPRGADANRVILYFHGGCHVFGSPLTMRATVAALGKRAGMVGILPKYPLAPEEPFPAAVEHAQAAYLAILDEGVDPQRIVIGGDSAGGNLALVLLARLCGGAGPVPAGVFAFSPLTDLTFSGDSIRRNARAEVILPAQRLPEMAEAYLRGVPADHPDASPLNADFPGAPPVWLSVGDTEILCDDTRRMAARLRAAGAPVTLVEMHDLPHVWPMFQSLIPEARETLGALATWIDTQTSARAPTR